MDTIKNAVVLELYQSLEDIPHIPDCVQNFEAFQQLPLNLLKEILLYQETDDEDEGDFKNKLQAMLMRGPPPQIHRKTHAPQQAASSNPEDLFDEKMALPKMQ